MIPRTQEAYLVYRLEERRAFGAGHLTRTKGKDSEEFIPISAAAAPPSRMSNSLHYRSGVAAISSA
jgi:hypothetical protein